MSEVRCPSCRGAKQVPKLGGMIGDCNLCSGKGTVLEIAKAPVIASVSDADVIKSTKRAVNEIVIDRAETQIQVDRFNQANMKILNDIADKACPPAIKPDDTMKLDIKKTIYKRKTSIAK